MMNIMQEIMKLLGVKENEEFELIRANTGQKLDHHYAFNKYGFYCIKTDDHGRAIGINAYATDMVGRIVDGGFEIVKIPWKPKEGERYYYCTSNNSVRSINFEPRYLKSVLNIKVGNCFKTEGEAEQHLEAFKAWVEGEPIVDWRNKESRILGGD